MHLEPSNPDPAPGQIKCLEANAISYWQIFQQPETIKEHFNFPEDQLVMFHFFPSPGRLFHCKGLLCCEQSWLRGFDK